MNSEILHILNGDATLEKFQEGNFLGPCAVWRETLSIGPLFYQVDSELFWDMRSQFMEEAYDAKLAEYRKKVIKEFDKLKKFSGNEVVLWYEYDVFCQVNFIAIMSYILKHKKEISVSLVCVGDYPGRSKRVGLGEIPASDYRPLFNERQRLSKEELIVADKAWMLYCGKSVDEFSELDTEGLPYLGDALKASKVLYNGELELRIRSMLQSGTMTHRDIIKELLQSDTSLGFGDLQYEYLIKMYV